MTTSSKERVCIGIPCFQGVTHEVLDDYMRFAYHLGRRNTDYDFFLAVRGKSEQFRARNAIVENALAAGCDYLFMLDDDHVIDVEKTLGPSMQYDFLHKLITHLKEDPKKGIVGALYFQRGATCDPVIMHHTTLGYSFYQPSDISRRLQKVDVTGGGAMCINMKVFDKIDSPWFEPELEMGTDLQICEKVANAGWEVWCDTSIELGHIMTDRQIVTSKNAQGIRNETEEWMNREDIRQAPPISRKSYIELYTKDVLDYTGKTMEELAKLHEEYNEKFFPVFDSENLEDYYREIGEHQLARNFIFHRRADMEQEGRTILSMFNPNVTSKGLDFGCGSAPIGFELALRGNGVDFVDIPGGYCERFVRWRCKRYELLDRCGFEIGNDYDWVLMLDSIEHLHPLRLEDTLNDIIDRLKDGGSVVTNYWNTTDYNHPEHISMDHAKVHRIFTDAGLVMMPVTRKEGAIMNYRWIKA